MADDVSTRYREGDPLEPDAFWQIFAAPLTHHDPPTLYDRSIIKKVLQMTKDKDLGSDAARSDPETADQDREALKRRAQENVDRSKKKDVDPDGHDEQLDNPTPGSDAAEPSPQ